MARLDLIIYGASGYSGARILSTLVKNKSGIKFSWGIAGRSLEKLNKTLNDVNKDTGENLDNVAKFLADTTDYDSLLVMASKARLILNCVGPYREMGEALVKACIEQNSHYIDISAETLFMEKITLNYASKAKEKAIWVVPASGYDSLAAEMAVILMEKKFGATLNTIDYFLEVEFEGSWSSTLSTFTTWETMVRMWGDRKETQKIQQKLYGEKLVLQEEFSRTFPHYADFSRTWNIPYRNADGPILRKTQAAKARPIKIYTYLSFRSFLKAALVYLVTSFWFFLSQFDWGLKLLLRYPRMFHGGTFSGTPSLEVTNNVLLIARLDGRGWKKTMEGEENSRIVLEIRARDPYDATAVCALISSLIILTQADSLPAEGGVYTPGTFFCNSGIVEELEKNGFKFEFTHYDNN